jgi:steroid delta-isomerase-like uncharacterized protein
MSQNAERTLAQWAALLTSHNTDDFVLLFTEDCVYEDVTFGIVNRGKSELRAFVERVFAVHPDFRIDLKSEFVAGEWAAMEWIMTGTHEGDLAGMPATHKKFSICGASVVELNNARIRRISDYWDLATFLKQTGLMAST